MLGLPNQSVKTASKNSNPFRRYWGVVPPEVYVTNIEPVFRIVKIKQMFYIRCNSKCFVKAPCLRLLTCVVLFRVVRISYRETVARVMRSQLLERLRANTSRNIINSYHFPNRTWSTVHVRHLCVFKIRSIQSNSICIQEIKASAWKDEYCYLAGTSSV